MNLVISRDYTRKDLHIISNDESLRYIEISGHVLRNSMTHAASARDKIDTRVRDIELSVVEQLVNDLRSHQRKGAIMIKPAEVDEMTEEKNRKKKRKARGSVVPSQPETLVKVSPEKTTKTINTSRDKEETCDINSGVASLLLPLMERSPFLIIFCPS